MIDRHIDDLDKDQEFLKNVEKEFKKKEDSDYISGGRHDNYHRNYN
jgi:hypothetical protein